MTKWFIQQNDEHPERGPLSPSELLELVRSGDVARETMVRRDDGGWFAAADVGGLFEAAMRPTIRYFCPQCKAEVAEPSVVCHQCGLKIRQAVTQIIENTIVDRAKQS